MYTLAFETSCDDTSVAILRDDVVIAISTRTQLEHDMTGGVVPEVAARSHANAVFPCLQDVLAESKLTLSEIDIIACTEKPWLLPSLLTGMTVASTLSLDYAKPLLWINHIESHMFANFLGRSRDDIKFPNITLTVSGWHTEIYLWKSLFEFELIGQSRDDAVWECFDKVAKMLGLWFPGWAKIAELASDFRSRASESDRLIAKNLFPRAFLEKDSLDFSFSGMKSAIKRYIDQSLPLDDTLIKMIAFATEEALTDVLVTKMERAIIQYSPKMMTLAGWVSANTILREKLTHLSEKYSLPFLAPVKALYSMDNAAMVWVRAYYESRKSTL